MQYIEKWGCLKRKIFIFLVGLEKQKRIFYCIIDHVFEKGTQTLKCFTTLYIKLPLKMTKSQTATK